MAEELVRVASVSGEITSMVIKGRNYGESGRLKL